MKSTFFKTTFVLIGLMTMTLTSCKKASTSPADSSTSAVDASNTSQHMNASMDDASGAAGNSSSMAGKTASAWTLVGATIDSLGPDSLKIVYDGTTLVDNRFTRSGSITVSLPGYPTTHWRDAGAVLNLNFNNVVYTTSNGSYTYNGQQQITNVSGGFAWQIVAGINTGVVIHHHTGTNISVTFPNGTVRSWSFDRMRTYTNGVAGISVSVAGNATEGGHSNVESWGTNRAGSQFYNTITQPIVFSNNCNSNYRDPMSGIYTHYVDNVVLTVTFGVNALGVPTTTCPDYGYLVTYTNGTTSYSHTFPYW